MTRCSRCDRPGALYTFADQLEPWCEPRCSEHRPTGRWWLAGDLGRWHLYLDGMPRSICSRSPLRRELSGESAADERCALCVRYERSHPAPVGSAA